MREGIATKVYKNVMRRIIVGDIAQGQILTDVGLAAQFNTSRTPVHEACIYLLKEGFLRAAPARGYIVTEISLDDVRELYELRLMLEPASAGLAAKASLQKDFFVNCAKLIEKRRSLKDGINYSREIFMEYGKAEYDFHCEIAKASGNKRLAKILAEIMNQFRRFHFLTFQKSPRLGTTSDEHDQIVEAIRVHDEGLARKLMDEHIRKGSRRAIQLAFDTIAAYEPAIHGD